MLKANVTGTVESDGKKYEVVGFRSPQAGDHFITSDNSPNVVLATSLWHSSYLILREIVPVKVKKIVPLEKCDITEGTTIKIADTEREIAAVTSLGIITFYVINGDARTSPLSFQELRDMCALHKPGGVGEWLKCEKVVEVEE